mmetsp:Transcript_122021/g.352579  ORF Transcript_122021/g.352579 Transcript_122021/m.352579 type:complete len:211 (-) Transcript_122021:659-1291(-)
MPRHAAARRRRGHLVRRWHDGALGPCRQLGQDLLWRMLPRDRHCGPGIRSVFRRAAGIGQGTRRSNMDLLGQVVLRVGGELLAGDGRAGRAQAGDCAEDGGLDPRSGGVDSGRRGVFLRRQHPQPTAFCRERLQCAPGLMPVQERYHRALRRLGSRSHQGARRQELRRSTTAGCSNPSTFGDERPASPGFAAPIVLVPLRCRPDPHCEAG